MSRADGSEEPPAPDCPRARSDERSIGDDTLDERGSSVVPSRSTYRRVIRLRAMGAP